MRWWIAVILLGAGPVSACTCYTPTVCQRLASSTVMFVGEVVSGGVPLREDPWHTAGRVVRFKVVERFRGVPAGLDTVEMDVAPTFGMCAPNPYFDGGRYLVTAYVSAPLKRGQRLSDGYCFQGVATRYFEKELDLIRQYAGKTPVHFRGTVMAQEKPLPGATVTASANGREFSTTTDAEGWYVLPVPNGDAFRLTASLPPYRLHPFSERPSAERARAGSCTEANFTMTIDNSISGTVFDAEEKPRETPVALLDLDGRGEGRQLGNWPCDIARSGTFRCSNVPLGRFLLMANPNGPSDRDASDNTYFPWGADRANAKVIEVTTARTHLTGMNLRAGKTIPLRQVTVRVRFADGEPMKTAAVTVTAIPSKGERPWETFQVASKQGLATLHVAANRRIRIAVKDWHGRDLGGVYESEREAGTDAVTAEFRIRH